jgi:DNA-binding IclR family transcriptional regulator
LRPRALTKREREVLAAIREIASDGWPVSVREVVATRGNSVSGTYVAMEALVALGAIRQHPRRRMGGYLPNPDFEG